MRTKEELNLLSNAITDAIREYHNAIYDNLKESGKEYSIESDWGEEEDGDGVHLSTVGKHDYLITLVIDKIRFKKHEYDGEGIIECHVCEEDYDGCDYWMNADNIDSVDIDYVYDNIIW